MARSTQEISRDIGETRSRLRGTSAALSYKADIPSRASEAFRETVSAVMEQLINGEARRERSTTGPSSSADVPGTGQEAGSALAEQSASAAAPARDQISHGTSRTGTQTQRAVEVAKENPLLLGLGAALAGAIAGLVLERSYAEAEQPAPPASRAASQFRPAVEDAADAAQGATSDPATAVPSAE